MRVLLLAAGLGTRLRPITEMLPKCLVPIGGKPLLQIWLERLTEAEFGPFLINTHYLHRQVEEFIQASQFKDLVRLVYEPQLLGTAGTLIKNVEFFQGQDGMVVHADNYCLDPLGDFLAAHETRPEGCEITMMTFVTDDPESCGIIESNEKGVVVGFHEKVSSPPGNVANGAVYIFSKKFLESLSFSDSELEDISRDIIPQNLGSIMSYPTKNTFIDIGTPSTFSRANSRCFD